jgi:hypothetical protein
LSPTPEWCAREKPTTFEKQKPYTSQQQKRKGQEKKLATKHNPSAPGTQRSHPGHKPRAKKSKNRALFCEERDQRRSLQTSLACPKYPFHTTLNLKRGGAFLLLPQLSLSFFYFFLSFFMPFSHFVSLFIILFKFLSF